VSPNVIGETSNAFRGHYLNWYDEGPGEFHAYRSSSEVLNIGQGYVSRFGTIGGTNPIILEGEYFTGDKNVTLDAGVGETTLKLPAGFNLLGNPYPSSLKWDDVYNYDRNDTVVSKFMYYYKSPTWKQADAEIIVDKDNIISSGQGFGVVLLHNNTAYQHTLRIPNAARTNNLGNGFNKKGQNLNLTFTLVANSNDVVDEIVYKENSDATTNYDYQYDAFKLNSFGVSPTPSFVTTDDKRLAICETPSVESIDLAFNMNADGEVVFSLSDVADFSNIILEDKQENTFTDLIKGTYTFQHSIDDAELGRFTLHFSKNALSEKEDNIDLKVYSYRKTLYISSTEVLKDVSVKLYNMRGQQVFDKKYSSLRDKKIDTTLNYGIYILEVTSTNGTSTQKISLSN